jgi:hypothetical protein
MKFKLSCAGTWCRAAAADIIARAASDHDVCARGGAGGVGLPS